MNFNLYYYQIDILQDIYIKLEIEKKLFFKKFPNHLLHIIINIWIICQPE